MLIQGFERLGCGNSDGSNLDWVYLNAVLGDHMPQVLYSLSNKLALLWLETKTSSIQTVHDLLQVRKVIFKSSYEHQYIVDVVHADLLCQPSQNCLHQSLKCRWCIKEFEQHHIELV